MDRIVDKISIINLLIKEMKTIKDKSILTKSKENIDVKIKILENNLEVVNDNIIDIISDLDNNYSYLSDRTIEHCKNSIQINETCKEIYPIILATILKNNFIDQEAL